MNEARARAVYAHIATHPGQRANRIARELGVAYSTVVNALAATEKLGLLLYEERGRLYVWQGSASAWRNQHADRQSGPK